MIVIILAGGFGTRLQSVVNSVAKPMANINSKPFLEYIFIKLLRYNISKVILSVGYKKNTIQEYFNHNYKNIPIQYAVEDKPLGTGGAIKKALNLLKEGEKALVLNGDTFFDIDIDVFFDFSKNSKLSLAVKPMRNFQRYGSIEIKENKVVSFQEKKFTENGYINAGVYCIDKDLLINEKNLFSFEDFLVNQNDIVTYSSDNYFIDIGIPEDYEKAKVDFRRLF